jgi:chemotaxis protein methyltransferase CheR
MTPTETVTASADAIVPVASARQLVEVTDDELARYADLIYRQTGIRVPPQKKTLLSNRIRRRLRETGIESFAAYYAHLKRLRPADPEWDAFLQEITTHETYLFRDEGQWKWFQEAYLPQLAAESRSGSRHRQLRIWSAACSTGDEAFTAACCIAACLPNYQQWQIRVVGTDIGTGAVKQAENATFGQRAMKLVPAIYRTRYFSTTANAGVWQARPVLTDMVTFRQHNLLDQLGDAPFDVVFLKNVLIYFAPESKNRVMKNVCSVICPGGLLVAGPTENISEYVKDYRRLAPWLYQRPQQ